MRPLAIGLLALALAAPASGQEPWRSEAEAGSLPLPMAAPPGLPEQWSGEDALSLAVRNVTVPTLRPVLPDPDRATGAAVVVVPGGAFVALSMGAEGLAVAQALADAGIAAFVLKYRTVPTPRDEAGFLRHVQAGLAAFLATGSEGSIPGEEAALADAQAALRLVAANAAAWGIDPDRLGMLGFSAGAITVLNAVLADAPDARPDFAGLLYGRMRAVTPPPDAPPLFVALAADDPLFGAAGFGLVESWRDAGRPVELHWFERGGHGFGLRPQGLPSDAWMDLFLRWLAARGIAAGTD